MRIGKSSVRKVVRKDWFLWRFHFIFRSDNFLSGTFGVNFWGFSRSLSPTFDLFFGKSLFTIVFRRKEY